MNLITLIGDIDENFYQLGLKDKDLGKEVHRDVRRMISTSIKSVDLVVEEVAKQVIKNSKTNNSEQYRHLKSYSEGLGVPVEEVYFIMLIPEIISAMTKWSPGFMKGTLGCSSFFMRNEKNEVVHGRILDFPLQGSFDQNERAILYDLNGMPKTLGFGAAGIPYPSITLMTEEGMTLALHQKFTSTFYNKGLGIFELIMNLLKNANDKKSALEFLAGNPSMSSWCLYMSFKNGDILACDLLGEKIFSNEYQLEENQILYFNNQLEDKSINQENFLPLGYDQNNKMREAIAHEKINAFLKKKKRNDTDLIKMMANPLAQKYNGKDYSHYQRDPLSPSSISLMTLNPSSTTALFIEGNAPKVFRGNFTRISNAFNAPTTELIIDKKYIKQNENYYQGLHSLMEAQIGFDLKDPQKVYHYLQFAIDHFENCVEVGVAQFYFLVAQYIYESHQKVLSNILHEFRMLEGKLPPILNDHCLLFIGRLEKILSLNPSMEEDKIINLKLKEVFSLESKIPQFMFHTTTKLIMIPRIDLLDIIYIHTI